MSERFKIENINYDPQEKESGCRSQAYPSSNLRTLMAWATRFLS